MTAPITSSLKYSAEEYVHLASRFRAAGDLSSALDYAGRALAAAPQDDGAHFLVAALHADVGLLERSIREYQDLLQRRPDWQPVRFNLGILWLNARRATEAREQFALIAAGKDPVFVRYARGMLAVIEKDFAKAREEIEAGLVVDVRPTEISVWIKSLAARLPASAPDAPDSGTATSAPAGDQDRAQALRGYNRVPKI